MVNDRAGGINSIPPTLICTGNIIMDNDAGLCKAVINFNDATAIDNSDPAPVVTQTAVPESGTSFSRWSHYYNIYGYRSIRKSSICSFTVTITDTEDLMIECQDQDLILQNETLYAVPNYVGEGIISETDNCSDDLAILQIPTQGTVVSTGTTEIIIQATNSTGNMFECSFNLNVDAVLNGEDNNLKTISMYPNPASGLVTVSSEIKSLELHKFTGRIVLRIKQKSFSVSALSAEIYMVRITAETRFVVKRLIVK